MTSERIHLLKERLESEFETSTISACSWDDAQSVTLVSNTEVPVYDFDLIAHHVTDKAKRFLTPSSVDSLYIEHGEVTFVEFKNMKWSKINSSDLQLKIHESIALLKMEYGLRDEDFYGTTIYIVHRPDPNTPPTHRHFHSLRAPKKYNFIENVFRVNVIRYMADDFEAALTHQKRLPLVRK